MKKTLAIIIAIMLFVILFGMINQVNAANIITNETESKLVEIKEEQLKTMADYQEKYGSKSYGTTAYVLHVFQMYSIPVCFIGIVISAIYKFVIGGRQMANYEKGLGMMVSFVTLTIICQVLPLIFAKVVKFGRE